MSWSAQVALTQPPTQYGVVAESPEPNGAFAEAHLSPAAAAAGRLRQMLVTGARNLQAGIDPPGVNGVEIPIHTIRSEQSVLGPNDEPRSVAVD